MAFIADKPEGCIDTVNSALRVNVVAGAAGGGGAVTVVDGGSVAEGATTDAAITTNTTGTISGKLRGLVAILADIWDSVNHRIAVALPAATVTTLTPPTAAAIGAAAPVPPSAAAIAAALANPLPVSLPAGTITTLTPLSSVGVNNFPATQPVSAVSLPLPSGAALETGNLAALVSNTRNDAQIVDLLQQIVIRLDAINITLGNMQGN